ncbi:MAG: class I SAM-dependent methyltransferase [Myxococcota bacterium]
MAKSELIARQSAHPTGLLGHVVARVMALDTARANRRVLEVLEPKPGERVLELGCGHGRTLGRVARLVAPGLAAGVDPSEVMRGIARSRNRSWIEAGTARVEAGDSANVPWPDGSFDKVFSVHTLYFWPDLGAGLREIRRVLREDGELLLAFHPKENAEITRSLPASVYSLRSRGEVEAELERSGFRDATIPIDAATGLALANARARRETR